MRILSVGEILWDVFDDREHLGGASLNLAFHLAKLGHEVALLTAVGEDRRGDLAVEQAQQAGINAQFIMRVPEAPTGVARVAVDSGGQPVFHIEHPAAYDFTVLTPAAAEAIAAWNPDWICFGTLFHQPPAVLDSTERLFSVCPRAGRLYDVNLRPGQYSAGLVTHLAGITQILKLSEEEAPELARLLDENYPGREGFLRRLALRFAYQAVCLTRGKDGCAVLWRNAYREYASIPVKVADAVGAGDAFSAAFLHGWALGWNALQTSQFANRVGGLVASRAGGTPDWSPAELQAP
jgi:fructokinase